MSRLQDVDEGLMPDAQSLRGVRDATLCSLQRLAYEPRFVSQHGIS